MSGRRLVVAIVLLGATSVATIVGYTAFRGAGYPQYWRDLAATTPPRDAFTLVALGDSATVGVGALDPANGLVGRAAALITERSGRPVHVVNLAAGGSTAHDVLHTQLPGIDPSNVDLVLLCTSNDLEQGVPLPQYQADLEAILAALPADRTIVSDLPLLPGREPYQQVLARVADQSATARADVAAVFRGHGRRLDIFSFLPPHLNDRGYGYWFDAFRPGILHILHPS